MDLFLKNDKEPQLTHYEVDNLYTLQVLNK